MNQNLSQIGLTIDSEVGISVLSCLESNMGSTAFVYQGSLYMILAQILYLVDTKGWLNTIV